MLSSLVKKKRESDANEHTENDKKRMRLHELRVASFDFFREAVDNPATFVKSTRKEGEPQTFGLGSEAIYRECYEEILKDIGKTVDEKWRGKIGSYLIEIRGSAGIGKSAFLALTMALELQGGMKNFALFHAPKELEDKAYPISEVRCSVWIGGELKMDGAKYGLEKTQTELDPLLKQLDIVYMDGCSMPINMNDFRGLIMVAASPSVKTKGLRKALPGNYVIFYMPPWTKEEYLAAGRLVGVDKEILKDNYNYMNGIIRYAFEPDLARGKVEEAIKDVNPSSIARLVASNETTKETEKYMVHSLVLWIPKKKEDGTYDYRGDVSYSLVSRIAERKVAKKLMEHELSELQDARRRLSPISGAEGYAGALFEAYAIKLICNGGEFTILKNESHQNGTVATIKVPPLTEDPIVLHTNKLDQGSLPFDTLLERTETNKFKPRLIWPETNNFPTFDAFYLHEDGELYPLQMTIAREGGFLHHILNNGGAYQTMKYLDALVKETDSNKTKTRKGKKNESVKKYKAIFVVPTPEDRCKPKKQKFTGEVKTSKTVKMGEAAAAKMMEEKFEQGIMYV